SGWIGSSRKGRKMTFTGSPVSAVHCSAALRRLTLPIRHHGHTTSEITCTSIRKGDPAFRIARRRCTNESRDEARVSLTRHELLYGCRALTVKTRPDTPGSVY